MANFRRVNALVPHGLFHLRDGLEALLFHHAQHLAVDLRLDVIAQVQVFALLHQQKLVNEIGYQLRLAARDLSVGFIFCQALLFECVNSIFNLAPEHGEHDDVAVDLCDHRVNDDRLAILSQCRAARADHEGRN